MILRSYLEIGYQFRGPYVRHRRVEVEVGMAGRTGDRARSPTAATIGCRVLDR